MNDTEKHCPNCQHVLPITAFPRDGTKKSGHASHCGDCKKEAARTRYQANPGPKKTAVASYKDANKEVLREKRHALRQTAEFKTAKNAYRRQKRSERAARTRPHDAHVKAWTAEQKRRPVLHDAHVRALKKTGAEWYRLRYQTDAAFNLKERLRRQAKKSAEKHPRIGDLLRGAINRRGTSPTAERLIGATVEQFRAHLERQFTLGMTWDAFLRGEIHIDHIVPRAAFNLHAQDDIAACWSLPNLRPTWARDNLEKRDRRVSLL